MHPVSFWTSLMVAEACILVMVEIFSGFASMPRWLMMNPSSFPDGTPKTHLVGLSFHWYSHKLAKVSSRSVMKVSEISGLDDHIIHVGFNVLVELFLETKLDSLFICCANVLQPKRHCCVAVSAERGDERGLLLVFFLDHLVVPRVAVEEEE